MVTRSPPSTPCKITAPRATAPRLRTHRRGSLRQSQIARMIVRNPTAENNRDAAVMDSPPRKENLSAGAWGRRERGGFVFRLSRWLVFRFRRTSWRPALRTGQLGALFEPGLIILRRIDHQ